MSFFRLIIISFLIFTQTFIYAQLSYNLNTKDAFCFCNGSATLSVTSGISPYTYTLNNIAIPSNTFNNLCPGTYTLFIQDSNIPPDTQSVFFSIQDSTFQSFIQVKDGCNQSSASVSITLSGGKPPYSYTISPINTSSALTIYNLNTGTYTLNAIDNNTCIITNTFAVNHYSAIANFSMSAITAKVGSTIYFTNISQYASNFFWDFGNGQTSTSYDASQTYTVQGTYPVKLIANIATCSDTSMQYLYITDQLIISIPNIFTPNYDGVNDLWYVFSEGAIDMQLKIYNRYGVKLFENNGTGVQWDGRTLSGEPVPDGTYFFSLEVTDVLNNVTKYNGYITLLR